MHSIYFTSSSCWHNWKWKSNTQEFSFYYESNAIWKIMVGKTVLWFSMSSVDIVYRLWRTSYSLTPMIQTCAIYWQGKKILIRIIKHIYKFLTFFYKLKRKKKKKEKCEKTGYQETDSKNRGLTLKAVEMASSVWKEGWLVGCFF